MKTFRSSVSQLAILCALTAITASCTDAVDFASKQTKVAGVGNDDDNTTPPIPPIVDVPPTPPGDEPPPAPLTPWTTQCPTGLTGDGKLTSCMSCPAETTDGDLSGKAKRLLDTMDRACRVSNKSEPDGYVPPAREELIHRLRACSPAIYPDTELTKDEKNVIPHLAEGNPALLKKMFGKLWYSPPYSDSFDHYFGLGIEEAVPLFCYKTKPRITGELWSREMWEWSSREDFTYWPKELKELHAYYQHVRSGLVACLDQNGSGGPSGPIATPGGGKKLTCDIKGFRGDNVAELKTRAAELLADGYTVSLENSVSCLMVTDANLSLTSGTMSLVGLKCK